MSDKELIKQEIERLINDKTDGKHVAKADIIAPKRSAYLDILNFIDFLPEEHNEDLEEELHNFLIEHGPMATLERCAKHFAEWGRNHFENKSENVNEDLEEAASKYVREDFHERSRADFKAGAEWQKQKDIKDFLEKAEKRLEPTFKNIAGYNCGGDLINDFINYMKDEM